MNGQTAEPVQNLVDQGFLEPWGCACGQYRQLYVEVCSCGEPEYEEMIHSVSGPCVLPAVPKEIEDLRHDT